MSCCGKVAGAIKLAKSELNIGIASDETVKSRRAACESCDRWEHGRCAECGCFTYAKTRLTNERCPLGRWSEP